MADGYDRDETPKVPADQQVRAKKRVNFILKDNKRARDLDGYDARTDQVMNARVDNFYTATPVQNPNDPVLVQVNHLKPWEAVYLAALSYGGFTPGVRPAPHKQVDPAAPEAIRRLLHQWLNGDDLVAKTRRANQLSINRGDAAMYLDVDWEVAAESPLDAITVDVVGRKEFLIDRCSKQSRIAYIGMILQKTPTGNEADQEAPPTGTTEPKRKTYAYLYDLDRSIPVDKSPDGPDADDAEERLGIYTCACLFSENPDTREDWTIKSIDEVGPIPYVDPLGRPVAPIVPWQLTPHPDYPLRGLPEALTPYNIAAAENTVMSWSTQRARADMSLDRVIETDRMNEENQDKLRAGDLINDIFLDPNTSTVTSTRDPISYPQRPVVPDSVKFLRENLAEARQSTSGVSELLQGGTQGKGYSTATESQLASQYSEASLAPLRVTENKILCNLSSVFLSVLSHVCDKTGLASVQILNPDGSVTEIPREWLLYPWNITMDGTGSTPQADAEKMQTFLQIAPLLEQSLMTYQQAVAGGVDEMGMPTPGDPRLAEFEKQKYKYLVQLGRLNDGFNWDSLDAAAATAPTPATYEQPGAEQMPPGEEESPAEMPIPDDVQAIMAEQGGMNAPA